MWRQIDGNPAPPEPGTVNLNREFTSTVVPGTADTITLGAVTRIQKDGYSNYNALQTKLEKRYSKGVTFIASYAYSKTMALGDTSGVQNPLDWRADYAPSSQDMRQHFVGSAIYALPFGRGKTWGANWNRVTDAFLGGWSGGPILTVNTGMPLNLSVVGDPSNTGQHDRPNVVGDWQLANPTVHEWFNTAAFVPNAKYTYGDAGRNILLTPGLVNLDFGAAQIVPDYGAGECAASLGVVQPDEHARSGRSQRASGQSTVRPDFFGGSGAGKPDWIESRFLKRRNKMRKLL